MELGPPWRPTFHSRSSFNLSEVDPDRELGPLLAVVVVLARAAPGAGQRHEVRDPQAAALPRPLLPARGDGAGGRRVQAGQLLRPHLPQPLPTDRPSPHLPSRHRAAQGSLKIA